MGIRLTYLNNSGNSSIENTLNGGIFIYDLIPDTGNLDLTMSENDTVVQSATASPDVSVITVHVFAYSGHSHVRPYATINSTPIIWTTPPGDSTRVYYGYVDITMNTGTLIAQHEDGPEYSVEVTSDPLPQITSLEFTGGYPGSQTELKENDNFAIRIQTDANITTIEVDNYGACKSQTITGLNTNNYTLTSNIANRGNFTQDMAARVRVQKPSGTWSLWTRTDEIGSVDGVNTVKLNNLHPSIENINQTKISYPAGQEAIKNNETADVNIICLNFDTITYSSPTGELSIPNVNSYEQIKTVERNSGNYNISVENFQISANRIANNATITKQGIVYIAHVAAEISMNSGGILRSGGNDNTSIQNHVITLSSNQQLKQAPTTADPPSGRGVWNGSWTGGPSVYTRILQVHDNDEKGTFTWPLVAAVNLAGIVTNSYSSGASYTLRGFVSRDITLSAFENEAEINVAAVSYSNVSIIWSVKSLPYQRPVGTTDTPDSGAWCLNNLNINPTTIRILDTAATDSSSQESIITIEEIV